jgi:hypothetical protein
MADNPIRTLVKENKKFFFLKKYIEAASFLFLSCFIVSKLKQFINAKKIIDFRTCNNPTTQTF